MTILRPLAGFESINGYLLNAGSLASGTPFVVLNSGSYYAAGIVGESGLAMPALDIVSRRDGIPASAITEDSTYGYHVVAGSSGISRDGSNNLVLTANDTNPVVRIRLRLLGADGAVPLSDLHARLTLAATTPEFGGGTGSPHLNSRAGFRCVATGVSSGAYADIVWSCTTATNTSVCAIFHDGVSTYTTSANGSIAFALATDLGARFICNAYGSLFRPSLNVEGGYSTYAGSFARIGQGISSAEPGFDWSSDPDQGFEYVEIYADQQAAGKDVTLTLTDLRVTPITLSSP